MKKLFILSVVSMALHFAGNAQTTRFGFTAGATIANYHSNSNGTDPAENGNSKIGLTGGLFLNMLLGKNFSFQPAINFVQKGTKDEQPGLNPEKVSINVNSIEVPLNLLYNAPGKSGHFFLGAGPSIAFGISGKFKFDDGTDSFSEDIKFGNTDNDDLRGLDLAANFLAGYSCGNGLMLSVNYNAGLSNLVPGDAGGDKLKSHYFGIKLGYILNKKEMK